MKKILIFGTCLLASTFVHAETIMGEVVDVKKNAIVVRTGQGEKMTLNTTDNTAYREKKVSRRGKMHKGKMHPADAYYRPMVEEDDWVEITYTPAKNNMQGAEVQEVVVYDD